SMFFFFSLYVHLRDLLSFPTRRSSDLVVLYDQRSAKHTSLLRLPQPGGDTAAGHQCRIGADERCAARRYRTAGGPGKRTEAPRRDRKSTRLNSSHDQISYAVFCLKKKK